MSVIVYALIGIRCMQGHVSATIILLAFH